MFLPTRKSVHEQNFMVLFEAYKNRLFGYILNITHSHYVAEEITQEIFLKLWLNKEELHHIENQDAYIFTMARNKTFNYLRKANYDEKLRHNIQLAATENFNNVEEQQAAADCEHLLEQAVMLLSPQRQHVYNLSRNKGFDHEEIASQLNLSRNTVKNHLVHALRFIRNYLAKNGISLLSILVIASKIFL